MRGRWLVAGAIGVALGACGAAPNGALHFELAFDGDPAKVAANLRERLAVVSSREDVTLGDVAVKETAKGGLAVDVAVDGGAACERFAVAKAAVRDALTKPRDLSLREVLPLDDAFVAAVTAKLGEQVEIERGAENANLVVAAPAERDVALALRELDTSALQVGVEANDAPGKPLGAERRYVVWPLATQSELRPGDIADARASVDDPTWPIVMVELSGAGAQRFEALTARLTGRFLAILVDDELVSVPKVQEPISGGRAQVTMGSGAGSRFHAIGEARLLALALRSGPIAKHIELEAESGRCTPTR